jgi:hypothetical protein
VFFNDPLPTLNRRSAQSRLAIAMREAAGQVCKTWRRHGHDLGFSVGISQGFATLGQIGFPNAWTTPPSVNKDTLVLALYNVLCAPCAFRYFSVGSNMPKQFASATGVGMTLGGALLLIGSLVCLSQYFYLYYAGISH